MTGTDKGNLRRAFGRYMTGVTVVTSVNSSGEPVGFTANSFTSVSLDPPLLLVCPGKFLSSHDTFAACSHFAVNVLAEEQQDVSNTFAGYKGDRFARVRHRSDPWGTPLIEGALAHFSCARAQTHDAGDHTILIGKVERFDQTEGRGLGYAEGQYFSLGLERAALDTHAAHTIAGAIIERDGSVLLERTAEGYHPPQISLPDRGHLREDLARALQDRGLYVDLKSAYSVFEDQRRRYAYLQAEPRAGQAEDIPDGFDLIAIDDLQNIPYSAPPIADMMKRFALEARHRSFGFYLGDGQRGDIHAAFDRS